MTRGAKADVTTAEYGIVAISTASRVLRSPEPLHATGEMLAAAAREAMASTTKGERR